MSAMKTILLPLLALAITASCQTIQNCEKASRHNIAQLKKLSQQYVRSSYANGIFIGYDKNEVTLTDLEGHVFLKGDYNVVPQDNSDLLMIMGDSLIGFMDRSGKFVLPMEYDPTGECACHIGRLFEGDGTYTLCRRGKYGVVDSAGNIIVPFVHDQPFWLGDRRWMFRSISSENRYVMEVQSVDGKVKIGPYNNITGPFYNYFLISNDDNLMGCIDTNGNVLLDCRYEGIVNVGEGRLALKENGKWSLFHLRTGRRSYLRIPNIEFHEWVPQHSPLIVCDTVDSNKKHHYYGAIDTNGNVVIPFLHEDMDAFYYRDYLIIQDFGGKSFVYNGYKGQLLKRFDALTVEYSEDVVSWDLPFLAVFQDSLWGIVDSNFNMVLPPTYHSLYILDRHHAVATLANGENALIDFQGHILFQGPFNDFVEIDDGLYSFNSFNPDKYTESIVGYYDRWGNSTITRKELRQARQWEKRRQEKNRERKTNKR